VVWGPELSPFVLKLESLLCRARLAWRRLPRDGSRLENIRVWLLVERAKRRRTALRPPANDALDEFPLVPFLVTPAKEVLYDTSALAHWLDERHCGAAGPLVPDEAALRFCCLLLDEAFDEFGLYMVHHNRWVLAAGDNDHPGRRLAREYAKHLPPGAGSALAAWFERRQVRRLPYLFSVAPQGYRVRGLGDALTPPSRAAFPPTHRLLQQAWERTLAAMEAVLTRQPFLLGERFTLADASAYGQLSMNLTDPAAARRLRELAPTTFAWLGAIRDRRHVDAGGELFLSPFLAALVDVFMETFVPLMRANAAAYQRWRNAGATSFNEKGFDAGLGLFDGQLLGHPYRSVVKTFQVRVWRDLLREWTALPGEARMRVAALLGGRDADAIFAA
jgi:glutathione S-transferase